VKEVEAGAPHQDDRPTTNPNTSSDQTADTRQLTSPTAKTPGTSLVWLPCTWDHPQDTPSQLGRRREAAKRSVSLHCGDRDPWCCGCTARPLTDKFVSAGREAAEHLMAVGCVPLLDHAVLGGLWRRGGGDRDLANRLHHMTRREVT
jgi:hypothetical protein